MMEKYKCVALYIILFFFCYKILINSSFIVKSLNFATKKIIQVAHICAMNILAFVNVETVFFYFKKTIQIMEKFGSYYTNIIGATNIKHVFFK